MHLCLRVDKIVRLIAYELVASGWKVTVVALACYCKSFKDLISDALWEIQLKMSQLLETFP